jgi:3-hydroxyisobutyrate dehydrogenase
MGGIADALRLAHDLALDRALVLDMLENGPLGVSAKQKRKMLESGEFGAATFSLDAMIKDLDLALTSAHTELPVTAATKSIAQEAATAGHGADDYASFAGYFSAEGRPNST